MAQKCVCVCVYDRRVVAFYGVSLCKPKTKKEKKKDETENISELQALELQMKE